LKLHIPEHDISDPLVSIVIPAANELITIGKFVEWCHEGLSEAGVLGEILIVSSSNDGTTEVALEKGARVLESPRLGLGRAYIDSIPFIRGKYVILGDADCTYDFRDIRLFIREFENGKEFIMGSRFKGSIEKNSMPILHRYFGTPITTWMLNKLFETSYSDIHCGMRGITLNSLKLINLKSQSWEYASEMIIKVKKHGIATSEVPVNFYKDMNGRQSHHKRSGWLSPFKAAWKNIKSMLIYGFDYLIFKPGLFLFVSGLISLLATSLFEIYLLGVTFSITSQIIFSLISITGLQLIFLSFVPKILFDFKSEFKRFFPLNMNLFGALSLFTFFIGVAMIGFYSLSVIYSERIFFIIELLSQFVILGVYLTFFSVFVFFNSIMINSISARVQNDK
jgi:glycosyltransferase involved in cell wall biosynthesis